MTSTQLAPPPGRSFSDFLPEAHSQKWTVGHHISCGLPLDNITGNLTDRSVELGRVITLMDNFTQNKRGVDSYSIP